MTALAMLATRAGAPVPFLGAEVNARIENMVAQVEICQRYRNAEQADIEVSYTFPTPPEAVLLGITAKIADREITGQIVESSEAEDRYEEAIGDGDSALMLQQVKPGLFSISLGNLQAGEEAEIRYHYAYLLSWNGNRVRFSLPTTIAPRYGDPSESGLSGYQVPEVDPFHASRFTFSLLVSGLLADAVVDSPSHKLSQALDEAGMSLSFNKMVADMDRDLVIHFTSNCEAPVSATVVKDGEGYLGLLSLRPEINIPKERQPRNLKIVLDCSGSMSGESIEQSTRALVQIVDALEAQDFVNVIVYGSDSRTYLPGQMAATIEIKALLREQLELQQADMGGTETGEALRRAYASPIDGFQGGDVLLVTDGQICNDQDVVQEARSSGHRVFTIGVGAAVSEEFLQRLAVETGGAPEMVSPAEDMAARIYRHFERMDAPKASDLLVDWPVKIRDSVQRQQAIYHGDTLNIFYWFDERPWGEVRVSLLGEAGEILASSSDIQSAEVSIRVKNGDPVPLARLAIAKKLEELDREAGIKLALQYQLLSPWTRYIAIDERAANEKAGDMPKMCKVPQILAAGWGGLSRSQLPGFLMKECRGEAPLIRLDDSSVSCRVESPADIDSLDIHSAMLRFGPSSNIQLNLIRFVRHLQHKDELPRSLSELEDSLAELLPNDLYEIFEEAINQGVSEAGLLTAILWHLLEREKRSFLNRAARKLVNRAYYAIAKDIDTELVSRCIAVIDAEAVQA